MKVICIDVSNLTTPTLTENKFYEIVYETNYWYEITDDTGHTAFYDKWRFLTIYRLRDQRINEIIN